MASVSESGHSVNVGKFFSLITFVSTYEPTYNPSNVALKSEALFELHNQAKLALHEVIMANTAYKRAVNNCSVEFKSLRTLCTRIVNALAASDVSSGMLKDAKALNRKMQGKRAAPKIVVVPEGEEAPKYISVSQQSRVDLMEHFKTLIALVESQPNYNPNEPDLKVAALKLKSEQLFANNRAVANAFAFLQSIRNNRNKLFYDPHTGVLATSYKVKKYTMSAFGINSGEYVAIKGILFRRF